jgi:hypothetical protein
MNGAPLSISASAKSLAPGMSWFSRYITPSISIKYPVFINKALLCQRDENKAQ